MRRPVVALTMVALALSTVTATASTAASSAQPRAAARTAAPDASGKGALSGMFPVPIGQLVAAGDLSGNGRADVLDIRGVLDESATVGITARDGRTGKPLWSTTVAIPPDGDPKVLPERLGAKGKPGVLVVDSYLVSGATGTKTVAIEALSGKTGKRLWSHSFVGTYGAGATSTAIPTFDGVIHDVKGPTMDALVTLETALPSAGGDQTTPVIVSGVNGSVHHPGAAVTSTAGFPSFQAIPDVTGDGLSDLLLLDPGTPGLVEAKHGHTGVVFWKRSQTVDSFTAAMAVGSYSRRSISDIAVAQSSPVDGSADITALSGHNGHKLWSRVAGGIYLLGKAGKHLQPALGLVTSSSSSTSTTSTTGLAYEAVAVTGKLIYSKHRSVKVTDPPGSTSSGSSSGLDPLGDVQPDGSLDQIGALFVSADSATKSVSVTVHGVVDGRTGRLRKVSFDTGADGSLRKGAATDLLEVELAKGKPQITARRGLTGKRYYLRTVPGLHHVEGAVVTGMRVSGNSCSDIALTTIAGTTNTVGVLSARGTVLWSVTFNSSQPTGGTLAHHKAPKHFCV
jgi:hypothetical protein